jgi:hypothetical protein
VLYVFSRDHHQARSLEIRVNDTDHAFELVVTEDHGPARIGRFHLIRDLIDRQKIIVAEWHGGRLAVQRTVPN